MKCFSINRNKKYIIYGAGGNCSRTKDLLWNAKYPVVAVLDKRAETIHDIKDVPVYTLENFAQKDKKKEDSIIIVSIKNVFEHINIVRELLEQGYENIIYKPFPILQGENDEEWDSINYAYELMVENRELSDLDEKKIACSRYDHLMIFKDELLIEEYDDQVMCWMPAEFLCNYNREDGYRLLPMAAYYPLLNMYQYLLNVGAKQEWEEIEKDFFLYSADWAEKTGKEYSDSLKKSMLNSRLNVFRDMQKKVDIDKNFFIRNAVSVKRIDTLRFYLTTSGRNRVSFLIARGYRYIPVYMSKEDYRCFMNQHMFEEFRQYLEKMKINQLFTTVQHPMMLSYMSEATDYVHLFCMPVIKEIYRMLHWKAAEKKSSYYKINLDKYTEEKEKLKILSVVGDEGCIGRLLLLHGINCYRLYNDDKQKEISRFIDRLYGICDMADMFKDEDSDEPEQCSIWIVDSREKLTFYSHFQGNIIFWLQWGSDDSFDVWKETFDRKKLLFQTVCKNEKVSGWMLEKGKREI